MPLLLDRYPLHRWTDNTRNPPVEHWTARLPVIVSLAGEEPSQSAPIQLWVVDTGFAGEAFAWRHHLESAGLDPDVEQGAPLWLRPTVSDEPVKVPVREADLWLVSNVPGQGPYCLSLDGGIAFRDRPLRVPDPIIRNRPE